MKNYTNFRVILFALFISAAVLVPHITHAEVYTKLYDFDGTNGRSPQGSLLESNGKFYGLAYQGGTSNYGVLFEYDPLTSTYTDKYNFDNTNGRYPQGSLIESNGKLYGLTNSGGTSAAGVLFEYDPLTSTYTKKYNFSNASGSFPSGTLIESNGKLYGLTGAGGASSRGTIFEYDPLTSTYTKLYDFNGTNGRTPYGALVENNSKFYGLTNLGGTSNAGVIFEYDLLTSTYTKLYDFNNTTNGGNPSGSLIVNNSKLYGLTFRGGLSSIGVIFEYDPLTSTYTKLYDFDGTNGSYPYNSLVVKDSKFYGLTTTGGVSDYGVIFEYDPLTSIYTKKYDFDGTNGSSPQGSLIISNSKFYGTTASGGTSGYGVIFEYGSANQAPTATSLSITGSLLLGGTLTGNYTYADADSDAEGTSTFRWLRDDVAIGSATSITYTTVLADVGHTIKFEVTPVAGAGVSPGSAATSSGSIISSVAPTVTTGSASSTTTTTTTFSGNITNTGGENNTVRGFQYGLTTGYGTDTTETGSFGSGSFTANITNLSCNTTYHFRSYSTNTAGTSTGSDDTVTTSTCPVYGHPPIQQINAPKPSTPPVVANTQYAFNKNIAPGQKHTDIKQLQIFLNSNGYIVAITGAGSVGYETNTFGPATKSALKKYQKANGITPVNGFLGPKTRSVINKLSK